MDLGHLDAIDQSITMVASTRRGQVPGLPFFGNEGLDWLDQPINVAAPNIIRGTYEAVAMWVPEAIVDRVIPTRTESGTEVLIVWHPANDSTTTRQSQVNV